MKPRLLWLSTAFLLVFFLSRSVALGVFPPFTDEAAHIQFAEQTLKTGPLALAFQGRLFTLWLFLLFRAHEAGTFWLVRFVTLLAVLPGFAATFTLGRLLAGRVGLILVGLFYLFSTYHMFFDRLALADPICAAAVSVALCSAYRLTKRVNLWDAIFTGLALFVAVGAKATALPYLGIPIAAALSLRPPGRTWRDNGRWLVAALGSGLGLVGAFFVVLTLLHRNPFSLIGHYIGIASIPLSTRLANNLMGTLTLASAYAGSLALVLLLIAVLILMSRRQWYLPLCLIGPVLVLWLNEPAYTRYYSNVIQILLVCGAAVLADVIKRAKSPMLQRPIQALTFVIVVIFGMNWLSFTITADTDPANLALSPSDLREYITAESSGFGLSAARDLLKSRAPDEVIGEFASCQAFQYLALHDLSVICPDMNPSGQSLPQLTALMNDNRRVGVFVILEQAPYLPQSAPGRLITVIHRPHDGLPLSIYDLAPSPDG